LPMADDLKLYTMMKIAVMAMTLLIGGIAFGQTTAAKTTTPEERAVRLTAKMTKLLELNADQAQKISDINLGIAGKNNAIRENTNFTEEQKQEIYQSNYEAAKSMYKGVLTEAQYTKLISLEKDRMEKKAAKNSKGTGEELDEL